MVQVKRIANKNAGEYASKLIDFKGSNLHGSKEDGFYTVWSYVWYPLFTYSFATELWYENEDRYSVSTSKQSGQSHPGTTTMKIPLESMKALIKMNKACA